MIIHTTSEGITFSKKLETDSSSFYESIVRKFPRESDALLTFVKENSKNMKQTERVYFGVISDAIEGSYAFNLEIDNYTINPVIAQDTSYKETLKQALRMEETIIDFYSKAAEQSQSLMADIPLAFRLLVKKRQERIKKLKELMNPE